MYSLDINFLKDRPDIIRRDVPGAKAPSGNKNMTPLLAGLAVGLLLPAGVGALWLLLQNQTEQLTAKKAQLEQKLNEGKAKEQQIQAINNETQAVKGETQALASVFNQLAPWSAILQDIRDRVPPGLQITSIEQTAPDPATTTAAPSPTAAAAPPSSNVAIKGYARSFDEVNDFLLTLQRSKLFDSEDTQIVTAELKDNQTQVQQPQDQGNSNAKVEIKLPKVVEYTIQTSLSDAPASQLLREWERKGAVGLATRLRNLQNTGALQK